MSTVTATMRAVVYSRYGGPEVALVESRPIPHVGPLDVLVRVEAASVSAADAAARLGADPAARLYFGLRTPRFPILGSDFAGSVQAVGAEVTEFAIGDAVVGAVGPRMGAHAELVAVPQAGAIAHRPEGLSAVEAVSVSEGGLTAIHFIRDVAAVASGQRVLVIGASGAVGASAVQLAALRGGRVTAVCSAKNAALARSLGAESVIDHAQTDFTKEPDKFDVIFDAVAKRSYFASRGSLTAKGVYLSTVPTLAILVPALLTKWSRSRRARIAFAGLRPVSEHRANLRELMQLAGAGALRPTNGGTFSFDDVANAYRLVDSGHKVGTVILVP